MEDFDHKVYGRAPEKLPAVIGKYLVLLARKMVNLMVLRKNGPGMLTILSFLEYTWIFSTRIRSAALPSGIFLTTVYGWIISRCRAEEIIPFAFGTNFQPKKGFWEVVKF